MNQYTFIQNSIWIPPYIEKNILETSVDGIFLRPMVRTLKDYVNQQLPTGVATAL